MDMLQLAQRTQHLGELTTRGGEASYYIDSEAERYYPSKIFEYDFHNAVEFAGALRQMWEYQGAPEMQVLTRACTAAVYKYFGKENSGEKTAKISEFIYEL